MTSTEVKETNRRAPVLPRGPGVGWFGAAGFVNALGMGFFYPFSLLFYQELSGERLSTVGVVLTVTAIVVLPALFAVGRVVDRIGPRPVLVVSSLIRALSFVGFVAVPGIVSLAVCSLLLALGNRADNAAAPLLALRMAPEGQSSRWLALTRVVFNAGLGLGALIAGVFIVDTASGFVVLGVIQAAGLVLTAGLYFGTGRAGPAPGTPPARPSRSPHARPWRNLAFMRVAVASGLLLTSALAVETGLPVYILRELQLPSWTVGVLLAVNTAMLALLQLPVSRVLDLFRPAVVLALGGLAYVALYLAVLLAGPSSRGVQLALLTGGMAVYTLGELAVSQAALVMLTGIPPEREKGSYLAFNQFFVGAATALSPLLVTSLLTELPAALWWVLAGVSAVAALTVLSGRVRTADETPAAGTPAAEPAATA